jgi:hypothetical protein
MQKMRFKRGLKIVLFCLVLCLVIAPLVIAASDRMIIKVHSTGDGRVVTVDLKKYFPDALEMFYNPLKHVEVDISNGIATITPKIGWTGEEVVVFSPNASLAVWDNEEKNKTTPGINLEPQIELSFPDTKDFEASGNQVEFSIAVFDPDNDALEIEWRANNITMQEERAKGGTVSRFVFNTTNYFKRAAEEKIAIDNSNVNYNIEVVINDSKNIQKGEWAFKIVNVDCVDIWRCGNWSDCTDGKKFRNCLKSNPGCKLNFNKPPTQWIDPTCSEKLKNNCNPNWTCDEWGECNINYNKGIISKGILAETISTKQERSCSDSNYCIGSVGIESRECNETIRIKARTTEWCFDNYIEVYNAQTGLLLSRIRESKMANQGLDIELSLKDLASSRYCWYCFDGVKDYDETDVDCGGSCEDCSEVAIVLTYGISDYKVPLMIFFDIVVIFFILRILMSQNS